MLMIMMVAMVVVTVMALVIMMVVAVAMHGYYAYNRPWALILMMRKLPVAAGAV